MPNPTSAARTQRYRERLKQGQTVPVCSCGRQARGEHAPLCSRCWLKTDAGREWQRLRVARFRKGLS